MNKIDKYLNSFPSIKVITIVGLYFSMGGLILEVFPEIINDWPRENPWWFNILKRLISTLNLEFFQFFNFFRTFYSTNIFNLLFYAIGVLGTVQYFFSKERETRFLRFFLAIGLLSVAKSFIISLLFVITYWSELPTNDLIKSFTLFCFFSIIKFYVIFWSLKALSNSKKLADNPLVIKRELDPYDKASRWQRLFNFIVDTYLSILILSGITRFLTFLQPFEELFGERVTMLFLMIIFRIIYYHFFEGLFGMTPAKFLSETRVIPVRGNRLTFQKVVGRTFSRFVPFEPFSFLGEHGWHDRWTNTMVVKEMRTGIKGKYYFSIIPIVIVLSIGAYFGKEAWDDRQSYLRAKERHDKKVEKWKLKIDNLSDRTFIKLQDYNHQYSADPVWLKVEDFGKDKVFCSILKIESVESLNMVELEDYYLRNQYSLPKQEIEKKGLLEALPRGYNEQSISNFNSIGLLGDSVEYRIEEIYDLFGPILNTQGSGSLRGDQITIHIVNKGRPCKVISIKSIDNNIKWDVTLPLLLPTGESYYSSTSLIGEKLTGSNAYHFEIEVEGEDGKRFRYDVVGDKFEAEFKEL